MPGQVGQLSQGPRQNPVADGTQVLEEQTLVVGDLVPAQELRLHEPFGERHFARQKRQELQARRKFPLPRRRRGKADSIQIYKSTRDPLGGSGRPRVIPGRHSKVPSFSLRSSILLWIPGIIRTPAHTRTHAHTHMQQSPGQWREDAC